MSVAFRALRAPIERPKPPSSRFSFYRRLYLESLKYYALENATIIEFLLSSTKIGTESYTSEESDIFRTLISYVFA